MDMGIIFTIEHPDKTGSLFLLDFQLNIEEVGEIHIEKAASRYRFVLYNSAFSFGAKIEYPQNELALIQRKCSTIEDELTYITHFLDIFKTNGYYRSIINRIKYPRHPTLRTHEKTQQTCFLEISHFSRRTTTAN